MKPSILVCLATRGKDLSARLFSWLLKQSMRDDIDIHYQISESNVSAVYTMRLSWDNAYKNGLIWDYYMFTDSDVEPKKDTIDKLIAPNKDVVIAPIWFYDKYRDDFHIGIHRESIMTEEYRIHIPGRGIEKVVSAHFSCTLLKRKVMEIFKDRKEDPVEWSPLIDEYYKGTHNDNIFYAKCQALGIETYVNWNITDVIHWQTVGLSTATFGGFLRNVGALNDKEKKSEEQSAGKNT